MIVRHNYQSHLRNKLIAEAFYLTGNIEKYGSGFIRIRKELVGYPEVSFTLAEDGEGVLVTFRLNAEVSGEVNEGVKALHAFVKENVGKRAPFFAQKLGTSGKNVERWLKQLKEEDKIEFRGAPKTGGYYPKDSKKSLKP